jgi:hypothetical protein
MADLNGMRNEEQVIRTSLSLEYYLFRLILGPAIGVHDHGAPRRKELGQANRDRADHMPNRPSIVIAGDTHDDVGLANLVEPRP